MLCPFCQHELDLSGMRCPRCGAEYPQPGTGAGLGMRVRSVAIAGVLLTVLSLIMVECVFSALPGGVGTGASPNLKSAEVQRARLMQQHHQQDSQNPAPPPPVH